MLNISYISLGKNNSTTSAKTDFKQLLFADPSDLLH